ncbi:MAG: hypothetical protein Fur002_03100 [Anaerolineales bacterium]
MPMNMNIKKLFLTFAFAALACNFPIQFALQPESTLAPTPAFTATPAPTPALGAQANPLILALAPSAQPDPDMTSAGERIAAFLESRSGYRFVVIAPSSESSLVEALRKNNAHIAILSPMAYALARQDNSVTALFASARNGKIFYAAQFIANRDSEFQRYFDVERGENSAEAAQALSQFRDKKPCWSDALSPSGYILPLGILKKNQINTQDGAFLQGQANVVRAVYAGNICNFGATYVDARALPALEAEAPDVSERVLVVWRTPEILPYENISVSAALPYDMRRVIQRALIDLLLTPEGKQDFRLVYGIDEMQVAEDSMYAEFLDYVQASGVDLNALLQK